MKKFLLFLFFCLTLWLPSSAVELIAYECLFGSNYNQKGTSAYSNVNFDVVNNGFTWNVVNFNNNNNGWNYAKCGGKQSSGTASITTKTAMPDKITKVVLNIGAITATHVTSIELLTSTSSDFSSPIEKLTFTKAKGEQTVTLTQPAANLYYQVLITYNNTSSTNGILQIDGVQYFADVNESDIPVEEPVLSIESGSTVKVGDTLEITCPTEGTTLTGLIGDLDVDGQTLPYTYTFTASDATKGTIDVLIAAVKDGKESKEVEASYIVIDPASGVEFMAYECLFGSNYNQKGTSAYSNVNFDVVNNGFTWNVVNFNNNNNGWNYAKCGGKQSAGTASITTKTAMPDKVTKVVLNIGAITATHVTSIELLTSTSSDFSSPIEKLTFTKAKGEQTVTLTQPAANLYYQVLINYNNTSTTNGILQIDGVQYFAKQGDDEPTMKSPGLSFSSEKVTVEGKDGAFTAPTLTNLGDGAVTYTSSNPNVATVTEQGEVTIVNYGSTTIKAVSAETDDYYSGEASYVIDVVTNETLTVAEALSLIEGGYNELPANVEGIISEITEVSVSFGNATYTIKDSLDDEKGLVVYRGYYLNGDKFTAEDQLEVGASVEVTGDLVNFNGTYEFTSGNKLVSYVAPVPEMYINAAFNDYTPTDADKLTQGDAEDDEEYIYRTYIEIPEGEFSLNFKFGNVYLVPAADGAITFDNGKYTGEYTEGDATSYWTVADWAGAEVEIVVDTEAKTVTFVYTPETADVWYIRGKFNNYNPADNSEWALNPVEDENGVYSGTFTVDSGEFSFNFLSPYGIVFIPASGETEEISFTDGEYSGTMNMAYDEDEEAYYWEFPNWTGGEFTVTIDSNDGSVVIKTDAKHDTDAVNVLYRFTEEDAIYNLQGVKVNNPVKGQIYIINGKKAILR